MCFLVYMVTVGVHAGWGARSWSITVFRWDFRWGWVPGGDCRMGIRVAMGCCRGVVKVVVVCFIELAQPDDL